MKQVPNCRICKWREDNEVHAMLAPPRKENICAAQGFQYCSKAYNTKTCRQLFAIRKEHDDRRAITEAEE